MADNVPLNPMTGGAVVRAKNLAGVETQVMQLDVGGASAESLVSSSNPLPTTATLPDTTASGTITANNTGVSIVTAGYGTVAFQVTGTWSGTIQVQATIDGVNWVATNFVGLASNGIGTTLSVNNAGQSNCSGLASYRLYAIAWSSGTATVTLRANATVSNNMIDSPLPSGTNVLGRVGIDQTTPGTTNAVQTTTGSTTAVSSMPATGTTAAASPSSALLNGFTNNNGLLTPVTNLTGLPVTGSATAPVPTAEALTINGDTPAFSAITGNPDGDFANVSLLEALMNPNEGLDIGVRVTNQPVAPPDGVPVTVSLRNVIFGQIMFVADCLGYQSLILQFIQYPSTGTFQFDGSNDNINWFQGLPVYDIYSVTSGNNFVTTITAVSNGGYVTSTYFRYIRLRATTTVSQFTSIVYSLRTAPFPLTNARNAGGTTGLLAGSFAIGWLYKSATILSGQTAVLTSATQLNSSSASLTGGVNISALSTNPAAVFLGTNTVTTTTGYQLSPGASIFLQASSLSTVYAIAVATGNTVTYIAN